MDGDEVDGAGAALVEEGGEPVETHGATTVGDGGCAELVGAGVGLHVGQVGGGGLGWGEVGLGAFVGLVEGHEVGGARGGDGGVPGIGEGRVGAPEHGHVFIGAGEVVGGGAPVVAPAH